MKTNKLTFIKNTPKYYEFIRNLRNDKRVQDGLLEKNVNITKDQQQKYMEKYESNFYICLESESPIGYIRHINEDIAVCVHPDHWGKGAGTFMVKELIKRHPNSVAKIKLDNQARLRAFEKAGFKKWGYVLIPNNE
jgi:RimJ/RimL family protein N-acetyltransferase